VSWDFTDSPDEVGLPGWQIDFQRLNEVGVGSWNLAGTESAYKFSIEATAPSTGCTYDLIADGGSPDAAVVVGSVSIEYDADTMFWTVIYETTGDWWIAETHLAAACDPADFPQTGSGNPKVGKFMYYSDTYAQQVTFIVPDQMCGDDMLTYFAAHAVVIDESDCWDSDGDGYDDTCREETAWAGGDGSYDFPGRNWATYVDSDCDD
jgi:hypothetical protein